MSTAITMSSLLLKSPLLLLAAITFLNGIICQNDATLKPNATGKAVVDAVLRIVDNADIFGDDYSFFTRLAYVESRFGEKNNTFRRDYYGGIWQVEESVFQITMESQANLTAYHNTIRTRLGIDWSAVAWRNLSAPLHSYLAAALYFQRVPEPIPQTLSRQADHWIKYYRPLGNKETFIKDSEELGNSSRCRGKMDLAVVLDSSGSINQHDKTSYSKATGFTADLIQSFTLDFTRIGMLVYSTDVRDIFPMNNTHTIDRMSSLARSAVYLNSGTRTDKGIYRAIGMFNDTLQREGIPKVMVVLTDGNSDRGSDLTGAIRSVESNQIKPISIGIGSSINKDELLQIALKDSQSVFQLQDFSSLEDFLFSLTSLTCEIPQVPKLNSSFSDSLVRLERRIYEIKLPSIGLTVNISISLGNVTGYWSSVFQSPSEAFNNGTLRNSTFIRGPSGTTTNSIRIAGVPKQGPGDEVIYFAIEGQEQMNNYIVAITEGGNGAGLIGMAGALLIALVGIHLAL